MSDLIERLETASAFICYMGSPETQVEGQKAISDAIAEIQSLQAKLKALSPVTIDEMPEEWKDGRLVDLFTQYGGRANDSFWETRTEIKGWMRQGRRAVRKDDPLTHVMLPPTIGGGDEG